jgi:type III pantothenate kinase
MVLSGFLENSQPEDGIISCVVPNLTTVWKHAVSEALTCRPLVVGPGLKTGLRMHFNDPAEVGPDRIADVVAARHLYGSPLVVVDLGTSTSFAVINKDGDYVGGLIASGLELSARALSQAAARLPVIDVVRPSKVIGKSTKEAMQSGFVLGEAARIDGLLRAIWSELGYETSVVVTGESASAIVELLSIKSNVEEALTLQGLSLLYDLNRS